MKHRFLKTILISALALMLVFVQTGCSTQTTETTAEETESSATETAEASETYEALKVLVEENIIGEETLNKMVSYLDENNIDIRGGMSMETPPDKPDGNGTAPSDVPEKPDGEEGTGTQPSDAPEKPSGEEGSDTQLGDAPEKPSGEEGPDTQPSDVPEKPDGENSPSMQGTGIAFYLSEETLTALAENGILTESEKTAISEYQSSMKQQMPMGGTPGGSESASYTGATEITESTELSGGEYTSEAADENAILVSTDGIVSLSDVSVTKSGDSDGGDNCSFYGVNAAVLAKDGAELTITGGTVTTSANGANGVFSYGGNGGQNGAEGDGTTVNITDTVITTTGDGSGGIMTTGGGVTNAENLTVTTSGQSSAAIRTDRGGGTVNVNGGTYTTNGLGSPAIYSTASVAVSNAALTSNLSEGVCIEGKNSVTLTDCDLTVNNTRCNGNATFFDSIMIYQSMSGDADSGTSSFTMSGGSLLSRSGHVFHVTNTHAIITLAGVTIVNEDDENILLSVCDDGWSGAENIAELYARAQVLEGTVLVGSNSSLTLTLSDGSSFTGMISGTIENASGTAVSSEVGEVSVTLSSDSTWTLTGDTYITSFTGDASSVVSNGYTLYVNGVALTGTK